ncbi:MAG: hypothetical protein QOD93_3915 [Acetobacteraceae bacterium]|jgi:hypothetical protein|nr:hypothetical protein [Acetobacteraceae bacterium]MEA2770953.1 hypothetical protein [Acetobacteraceae bacterium]
MEFVTSKPVYYTAGPAFRRAAPVMVGGAPEPVARLTSVA